MILSCLSRVSFVLLLLAGLFIPRGLYAQPLNDNLCNAIAVELNEDCSMAFNVNNLEATAESNEPMLSCGGFGLSPVISNSVWYSFVAPAEEVRILTVPDEPGRNFNLFQMQLFTLDGDCTDLANLTEVACDVPSGNLTNSPNIITTLTEGETYYVQISGTTNPGILAYEAEGCLTITEVVAPVNDAACNALALDLNAAYQAFSNVGATTETGEFFISPPADGVLGTGSAGWGTGVNFLEHSVWFTFTTPAEEVGKITVDLSESFAIGGNFNAQAAIYTATDCVDLSTFTFVAGNDNSLFEESPANLFLTAQPKFDVFCLEPSTTYYLVVDGAPNFLFTNLTAIQGDFILRVLQEEVAPLDFVAAVDGPTCAGDTTGTIVVNGRFGAETYEYAWEDGDSTAARLRNLSPGDYNLTITDICGEMISTTINVPESAYGSPNVSDVSIEACEGETVQLSSNVSGGLPFQNDRLFTIDFAGLYARRNLFSPSDFDTLTPNIAVVFKEGEIINETLYATTLENAFYQVNLFDGEVSLILDSIPLGEIRALSYVSSTETLYAYASQGGLYSIELASGIPTFVQDIPTEFVSSVAIDNDGRAFFTVEGQNELYAIQLGSTIIDTIGDFATTFVSYAGLKIDHRTNSLYTAGTGSFQLGTASWQFYQEINKTDASILASYNDYVNGSIASIFTFLPIDPTGFQDYMYFWSPQDQVSLPFNANPTTVATESGVIALEVNDACAENASADYNLTVNPTEATSVDIALTEDSTFIFNGVVIDVDTVLIDSLQTVAGCDSIVTINVSIVNSTQNHPLRSLELELSPNPSDYLLRVRLGNSSSAIIEEKLDLAVVDLHGRLLHRQIFSGHQATIEIGHLPAGVYTLRLGSGSNFTVQPFVKL